MTDRDMENIESLFQRYIGVFVEDFQQKLDLVVEGHIGLDRKIDQKFDQLEEKIEHNTFLIGTLNEKIDAVATDLKATDKRLSDKIDGVAADLKATDKRLSDKIDGVAADLKATDERLSDKMDSVEENLSNKIDGVALDLKAHRSDTEAHHGVYRVKEG